MAASPEALWRAAEQPSHTAGIRLVTTPTRYESQRGGAWDWVVVVVAASAILGDTVLFRIKHVVSERRGKGGDGRGGFRGSASGGGSHH